MIRHAGGVGTMTATEVLEALDRHPFTHGLGPKHLAILAAWTQRIVVPAGQYLGREREEATACYLVESGRVALETHTPARGVVRIETIGPGEVVGWSWLVPPHRWQFDGRVDESVQALELDGIRLRNHCLKDHELGNVLLQRLVNVVAERLSATRLQLLGRAG
jgi:CRP/FNR family cyclic AMP-dependent transcriptional regulator